jgi:protein-L-isoaspartate(D-aspartate) O-methyltransferase
MKIVLLTMAIVAVASHAAAQDAQCVRERAAMIGVIQAHVQSDTKALPNGLSTRVVEALERTPRHLFMSERSCPIAYADKPVPIGQGQTISQPYSLALMTELSQPAPDHVALEIGTGSGYQAAILAMLVRKVCTIEIIQALATTAARKYRDLGYDNVSVRVIDGYHGWPECGPFDSILVTAALPEVPPALIEQLKVGGRLIMPVGSAGAVQRLTVIEKIAPDKTTSRAVALVRFVPFTRSPN